MKLKAYQFEPSYENSFVVLYGGLYIGVVYYIEEWKWWGMGCCLCEMGADGIGDKLTAVKMLVEDYLEASGKKFSSKKLIQLVEVK